MYEPKQGDIVFLDFSPQIGHEESGKRPALVISNTSYHKYTNLSIVCPVTNTDNGFPLHVRISSKQKLSGFVLCEHLKSVDLKARNAIFKEKLSKKQLQDVLARISLFFVS